MSNCPSSCSAVVEGGPDLLWSTADGPVLASKILVQGSPSQHLALGLAKPLASMVLGPELRGALEAGPGFL